MRVRLLTGLAGARVYNKGDIYECDVGEAYRLIERGYAEADKDAPLEFAIAPKPQRTTAREIPAEPAVAQPRVETALRRRRRK